MKRIFLLGLITLTFLSSCENEKELIQNYWDIEEIVIDGKNVITCFATNKIDITSELIELPDYSGSCFDRNGDVIQGGYELIEENNQMILRLNFKNRIFGNEMKLFFEFDDRVAILYMLMVSENVQIKARTPIQNNAKNKKLAKALVNKYPLPKDNEKD